MTSSFDYQTLSRSNRSYPVPTLVDATQKSGKDNNNTSHVLHVETITPQEKNINHSEIPWIYLSTFYTFALSHSRRHHGNKYFVLFSICKTLSPRNVAKNILTTTPVVCVYKHIYHLIIMMNLLTRLLSRRLRSL